MENYNFYQRCVVSYFVFFSFLGSGIFLCAQENEEFDKLYVLIEQHSGKENQRYFLEKFLDKAKEERNFEEIVNGYRNYLHYTTGKESLIYGDSMVWAAYESQHNLLVADALLSKGIQLYGLKNYKEALSFYLWADDSFVAEEDMYLKNKVRYHIAQVKYYLEDFEEALKIFEGCLDYFQENHIHAYLNTLHSIASCYTRLGDYKKSDQYIQKGKEEGHRFSISRMNVYFAQLEGINSYYKMNYVASITSLKNCLNELEGSGDFGTESVSCFYLGKSYLGVGQFEKAIAYFKRVEKYFIDHSYIRSDLREAFEILADFYLVQGDVLKRNWYLEQKIKADKIVEEDLRFLYPKISKGFDEKEALRMLESHQNFSERVLRDYRVILLLVIIFLIPIIYLLKRWKRKKITSSKLEIKNSSLKKERNFQVENEEDLSANLLPKLLKSIEKFETEKKYLEKDWTQAQLAVMFQSNVRYVNEAIRHYRQKKYSDYINDLRVDYLVELLERESKLRNYSNRALAEEVGFSSTERLVKAFKQRMGISPTDYISHLKSKTSNNS